MTGGPRALFVGDAGLDTTVTVARLPGADEKVLASSFCEDVGGVVANAAVACDRAGAAARLLCAVGDDVAGEHVVAGLGLAGLAVESIVRRGTTCRALVTVEASGEKRLILVPGVSMFPDTEQVLTVGLGGVAWVHTAAYDLDAAATLAQRCREADVSWSVDLEPATFQPGPESLQGVLAGAAVVFVNRHAGGLLGADPAAWLFDRGVRGVVLSDGAAGARWVTPDRRVIHVPPAPLDAPVVDTTGAGDCLAGWFIAETLAGAGAVAALGTAVAAASLSCTRLGAQASFPTRDEMHTHLSRCRDLRRKDSV